MDIRSLLLGKFRIPKRRFLKQERKRTEGGGWSISWGERQRKTKQKGRSKAKQRGNRKKGATSWADLAQAKTQPGMVTGYFCLSIFFTVVLLHFLLILRHYPVDWVWSLVGHMVVLNLSSFFLCIFYLGFTLYPLTPCVNINESIIPELGIF